jgi:monothiol glutaredoxin
MNNVVFDRINKDISENKVVLYMKGTVEMPMCGFSGTVVTILNRLEVPFKAINVLEDEEIRQGIKDFANWPTIPQLYINGEFVGGCDIVKEMYISGELQGLLA